MRCRAGRPSNTSKTPGPIRGSYRVDFSKIAAVVPSFQPQWTLAEGVRQLLTVFLEDGMSVDDFRRYRRLYEIKRLIAEGTLDDSLTWA